MDEPHRQDGRPSLIDWHAAYLENLPRVFNYFRFRVGDDFTAEDLTAATFEKAWRNRARYDGDIAAFSSWLFGIAVNTAVDYFRRAAREHNLLTQVGTRAVASAEQVAELHDEFRRLLDMLSSMPTRDADVFAMKYGAELTNRQISYLTGLSESNVGTIVYRVVKRIRANWGADL